jgi:fatty-acyl-CoA synthase
MRRDWAEVTTVGDLLARGANKWPEKDALVFPDSRRTFSQLYDGARQKARSLIALGIQPGERIGLLMPNCPDFVETIFAGALVGIPVLTINARFKSRELTHILADADVAAVLTTDLVADHVDFAALLDEASTPSPPALRLRVLLGSGSHPGYVDRAAFESAAAQVAERQIDRTRRIVRLREEALMMYTSGTTASPKGCPFTHEALMRAADAIVERFELASDDCFWDPLPMYHLSGLLLMLSNWIAGATFVSQLHWDPGEGLRLMTQERCTFAYPTFPTFVQDLLHHPDFAAADLSRLRGVLALGTPDSLRDVQRRFSQAVVVSSYGITECGGVTIRWKRASPRAVHRWTVRRSRSSTPTPTRSSRWARWARSSCVVRRARRATTEIRRRPRRRGGPAGSPRVISDRCGGLRAIARRRGARG